MATIMTSIELQDRFSTVVHGMISAVNLSISAMYDMREAVSADINTASLESAKEQIDSATLAARQLQEAMQEAGQVKINMMQQPVTRGIILVEPFLKEQPVTMEPVKVPVEWKTDDLPVFTGTGIERFTQEVQEAARMMDQLAGNQTEVIQQAESVSIFSPEEQQDLARIS